jgi:glycerophosphoryl diester phosphodiesterase
MPLELFARRAGRPLISAHRGFSTAAPENTIAALDAAWRSGADVAEIDVQLTRDGYVVLMHNRSVERTTSGAGLVKDLTLAELKTLDAGGWFDRRFRGERVPTLAEALEWSGGRLGLLIELKNYPFREMPLVEKTIEVIERHHAEEFVVPAGFDHVMLAEIHRMRPGWPLEMIYTGRLADPVHAAHACGATLVSLEPEFCLEPDIQRLHAGGVSALTTLTSPAHAPELLRWGLDIFESNDAGMVASALGVPPRA